MGTMLMNRQLVPAYCFEKTEPAHITVKDKVDLLKIIYLFICSITNQDTFVTKGSTYEAVVSHFEVSSEKSNFNLDTVTEWKMLRWVLK